MTSIELWTIREVRGIYSDAFITDASGYLVFGSFWGRDTSIQELFARLSLSISEGGVSRLTFVDREQRGHSCEAAIGDRERLTKITARMPRSNLFGDMAHVWLFDRLAVRADLAQRKALRIFQGAVDDQDLWKLIQELCHLPLLDHWREAFVRIAFDKGWLTVCDGKGGVSAVELQLPQEEVEAEMEARIRDGTFALRETPMQSDGGKNKEPSADTDARSDSRLTAEELAAQMSGFIGTTDWYRHSVIRKMTYTDGVRFFAREAGKHGAYWFVDLVATEAFPLLRADRILSPELRVSNGKAVFLVRDENLSVLHTRRIDYTDCQEGTWKFYLQNNVLFLPSEY